MTRIILIIFFISQLLNECKRAPDYSNGKKLFENHCISCHATAENDLFLKSWKREKSIKSITESINFGIEKTEMPSFRNSLSKSQVFEIASYIVKNLNDSLDHNVNTTENQNEIYTTDKQLIKVEKVFDGLDFSNYDISVIWSIDFLDSNNLIFSNRSSGLFIFNIHDDKLFNIKNSPKVYSSEQGGLLEVKVHPNFRENKIIFLTYTDSDLLNSWIVLSEFKLFKDSLALENIIFKSSKQLKISNNFGSRIAFDQKGFLYLSVGDRTLLEECQNPNNNLGKIHRFNLDGTIPFNNPYKDEKGKPLSVYTIGHRNSQGLALQTNSNNIWEVEHGPMGGDELNLLEKGGNYGWPIASYGTNYNGSKITDSTHIKGTIQPKHYWVPSIAPGDVTFYSGKKMEKWKGDIFVTGLRAKSIFRLELDSLNNVVSEENLFGVFSRMRAIEESPDGYLYFTCELFQSKGRIYRITSL